MYWYSMYVCIGAVPIGAVCIGAVSIGVVCISTVPIGAVRMYVFLFCTNIIMILVQSNLLSKYLDEVYVVLQWSGYISGTVYE